MSSESLSILKKFRVHVTKPRILILEAFLQASQSLDYHYFLYEHGYPFERTTLFRTLRLFTQKKIIYMVSAHGTDKYLLHRNAQDLDSEPAYSSFVCINCGKAIPLDSIQISSLKMPQGFSKKESEIIIHGLCPACKT